MKIQIEVSEKQAQIILEALDLYSRLGMGQMEEVDNLRSLLSRANIDDRRERRELLEKLKKLYFPELSRNEYYGIFGDKTPEESKIAYDLIQVLRNKIAYHKHPEGGMTVDFGTPLKSSKTEELCECNIVE